MLFISSVGAVHKKFFIGMNAATWFMYTLCLFCERWLRHVEWAPLHTSCESLAGS